MLLLNDRSKADDSAPDPPMAAGALGRYVSSMPNLISLDIEDVGEDVSNWRNIYLNLHAPSLASVTFSQPAIEQIEQHPDADRLNAIELAVFIRNHPHLEVIDHQFPCIPVLSRITERERPEDFLSFLALYIGSLLDIVFLLNHIHHSIPAVDVAYWPHPTVDEGWKLINPGRTSISLLIVDMEYLRVSRFSSLCTHAYRML